MFVDLKWQVIRLLIDDSYDYKDVLYYISRHNP